MAEENKKGLNVEIIENDLENCCLTEGVCGPCWHERCVIGYAKQCLADFKSNRKTEVENGMERIPAIDVKVFEDAELETAIAHMLKECKNCRDHHTDDCIINVLRSCFEVGLFGDIKAPYEGTTLQYLMRLKTAFPENAARISEQYMV